MAQLLAASSSGFNDDAVDLLCANSADAKFTRGFGSVAGVCVGSNEVNAVNKGSCEDMISIVVNLASCTSTVDEHTLKIT